MLYQKGKRIFCNKKKFDCALIKSNLKDNAFFECVQCNEIKNLVKKTVKYILKYNFNVEDLHISNLFYIFATIKQNIMITKEEVQKFLEQFNIKAQIFGIQFRNDRQKIARRFCFWTFRLYSVR